jgi:hypothetical protein
MKRREFITLLGGAAAWPLAARAQQDDRVRRIGVLMPGDENNPVAKPLVSAFIQALAGLGWTDGRNARVDVKWTGYNIDRIKALAQELVGLQPDIIVTSTTPTTAAVQRETQTIPILFATLGDPVASGIVARLDRPSVRPSSNKINELRYANFSNPRIRPRSGGRFFASLGAPRARGVLRARRGRENAPASILGAGAQSPLGRG